jgi:hypothetical protein
MLFVVPSFAPFALFIAWLYIRLAPPYIQASRDLRRLESISLSPTFAGFDELLRGITHIRAFGMENRYQNTFYAKVCFQLLILRFGYKFITVLSGRQIPVLRPCICKLLYLRSETPPNLCKIIVAGKWLAKVEI